MSKVLPKGGPEKFQNQVCAVLQHDEQKNRYEIEFEGETAWIKEADVLPCHPNYLVQLSDNYRDVGDAKTGPLAPHEEGLIREFDSSDDTVKVAASGKTWWYSLDALRISYNPETKHAGEWRNQSNGLYCSLPSSLDGVLCLHTNVIHEKHWSCCGSTNANSTCFANQNSGKAESAEEKFEKINFAAELSSPGVNHIGDSGAKFPDGPAAVYSKLVVEENLYKKVEWSFTTSGNSSWIIGLVPENKWDSSSFLYETGNWIAVKTNSTSSDKKILKLDMHSKRVKVTVNLSENRAIFEAGTSSREFTLDKITFPFRFSFCGFRNTKLKQFRCCVTSSAAPQKTINDWLVAKQFSPKHFEALEKMMQQEVDIISEMKLGNIKIGFSDSLVWPAVFNQLKILSDSVDAELKREEDLPILVQETEKEIARLQELLEKYNLELDILKNTRNEREEFRDTNSLRLEMAAKIQAQELSFAKEIDMQIAESGPTGFSSLSEETEFPPPLSLVLNAFGISPEAIQATKDMDGDEFLNDRLDCDVTPMDIVDLEYCKHMLKKQKVPPFSSHFECCAVCQCSNAEELIYLLEEHKKEDLEKDILKKKEINGPRILMLTMADIQSLFNVPKATASGIKRGTISYLKKIHVDALKSGPE
mmetsp:Transcript_5832/g.8800  ORF Transcript_5832/g.8800 Transcript_5832/m.8800 type:complete len:646 (+) Transcript_5832:74-2011(+)